MSVSIQDIKKKTQEIFACFYKFLTEVYRIPSDYLDYSTSPSSLSDPFLQACSAGDLESLIYNLPPSSLSPFRRQQNLLQGLIIASIKGHLDILRYLHGKEHDSIDFTKDVLLKLASRSGHKNIVSYLLEHFNSHLSSLSALFYAIQGDHLDIVKLLLGSYNPNSNPNPKSHTYTGISTYTHGFFICELHLAFLYAISEGRTSIYTYLLYAVFSKCPQYNHFFTMYIRESYDSLSTRILIHALEFAVHNGDLALLDLILGKAKDLDYPIPYNTILGEAIQHTQNISVLERLVELVGRKQVAENIESIYFPLATESGHIEVIDYIMSLNRDNKPIDVNILKQSLQGGNLTTVEVIEHIIYLLGVHLRSEDMAMAIHKALEGKNYAVVGYMYNKYIEITDTNTSRDIFLEKFIQEVILCGNIALIKDIFSEESCQEALTKASLDYINHLVTIMAQNGHREPLRAILGHNNAFGGPPSSLCFPSFGKKIPLEGIKWDQVLLQAAQFKHLAIVKDIMLIARNKSKYDKDLQVSGSGSENAEQSPKNPVIVLEWGEWCLKTLSLGAEEGDNDVLRKTLSFLGEDSPKHTYFKDPLHLAAREGHLGALQFLICDLEEYFDNKKLDRNALYALEDGILIDACIGGHCEVIKYFLSRMKARPGDIETKAKFIKGTPGGHYGGYEASEGCFLLAAAHGHLKAVKILLEFVTRECSKGFIDMIVRGISASGERGHLEVLKYLMDYVDGSWDTLYAPMNKIVGYAFKLGYLKILDYLINTVPYLDTPENRNEMIIKAIQAHDWNLMKHNMVPGKLNFAQMSPEWCKMIIREKHPVRFLLEIMEIMVTEGIYSPALAIDLLKTAITADNTEAIAYLGDICQVKIHVGRDFDPLEENDFTRALQTEYPLVNKVIKATQGEDIEYTILKRAISTNDLSIVAYLWELRNVDIHFRDEEPLLEAIRSGSELMVVYLTDIAGANLSKVLTEALNLSIENSFDNITTFIIEKVVPQEANHLLEDVYRSLNQDPPQMNLNDLTLIWSVCRNNLKVTHYAIDVLKANLQAQENLPLRLAARVGHLNAVKCLIQMGADVHAQSDQAVQWAAENNHIEVFKYLVREAKANIHARNDYILLYAAEKGYTEIVEYIINAPFPSEPSEPSEPSGGVSSASLGKESDYVSSIQGKEEALIRSVEKGHLTVFKCLVERAHIDPYAQNGKTLYKAVQGGHLDIVKYILSIPFPEVEPFTNNMSTLYQDMFVLAAKYNHLNVLKYLMNYGGINSRTYMKSALFTAASEGHSRVVRYLKKLYLSHDYEGERPSIGTTPLPQAFLKAAEHGHTEVLRDLLGTSLNPSGTSTALDTTHIEYYIKYNDYQALRLAAAGGHLNAVKCLLTAPFPSKIDTLDCEAFRLAASHGHLPVVTYFLEEFPEKVNPAILDSKAFRLAASHGHLPVVQYLHQYTPIHGEWRVNIHARNDEALRLAAAHGHLEVVKYLVKTAKANIGAYHHEAFREAAANGHLEVVVYLVEAGAEIMALDGQGLHRAAGNGHIDVVKYLLGDSVSLENSKLPIIPLSAYRTTERDLVHTQNDQALRQAASKGHLEVVKYLVEEKGADVHALDDDALLQASMEGRLEVVRYLLGKGRDGNNKNIGHVSEGKKKINNNNGNNNADLDNIANVHAKEDIALRQAALQGHYEVVKCLIEEGDANYYVRNGETLILAIQGGHFNVVKYLLEERKMNHAIHDGRALIAAVAHGQLEIVKYLIEEQKVSIPGATLEGEILYQAVSGRHLELIKYLYPEPGEGALKPSLSTEKENTPYQDERIIKAIVETNFKEAFGHLIASGRINVLDTFNWAVTEGHIGIVKYIIRELRPYTEASNTFFIIIASLKGNLALLKELTETFPITQEDIKQILKMTAYGGHVYAFKYLMRFYYPDQVPSEIISKINVEEMISSAISGGCLAILRYLIEEYVLPSNILGKLNSLEHLEQAVLKGHIPIVEYLIQKYQINIAQEGTKCVFWAIKSGHLSMLKKMIQISGFPDLNSQGGRILLNKAFALAPLKIIRYLIEASPGPLDPLNESILHTNIGEDRLDIFKYIIETLFIDKALIGLTESSLIEILRLAVEKGHLKLIKYLFEAPYAPISPSSTATEPKVPRVRPEALDSKLLELTVQNGHMEVIKYLIESGKVLAQAHDNIILVEAAKNGHLNLVEYLIEECNWVTIRTKAMEALTWAAANGHEDVVKALVEKGNANVAISDLEALIKAFCNGHLQVAKYLIAKKATLNTEKDKIIVSAISNKHEKVVRYLIDDMKMSIDTINRPIIIRNAINAGNLNIFRYLIEEKKLPIEGLANSLLDDAASHGFLDMLRYLIEQCKVPINTQECRALVLAAKMGHLNVIKYLIEEHQVNPRINDNIILIKAAQEGHLDVVKYLTETCKVDINPQSSRIIATIVKGGQMKVLKYLMEYYKIKPDTKMLYMVASGKQLDIVKFFVEECAVKVTPQNGVELLHHAVSGGCLEVVRYIVDKFIIDIHANNDNALRQAVMKGYLDIVNYIVREKGGNVNIDDGQLVISAARSGDINMLKYLVEEAGGEIQKYKNKALQKAIKGNHFDIVVYLVDKWKTNVIVGGYEVLSEAIDMGYVKVVKYLIDKIKNTVEEQTHKQKQEAIGYQDMDPIVSTLINVIKTPDPNMETKKYVEAYISLIKKGVGVGKIVGIEEMMIKRAIDNEKNKNR